MNLKKILPKKLKRYMKSFTHNHNMHGNLNAENKVFVALAADYGNLGDVAISHAQYNFIKSNLKNYEVIDVPIGRSIKNIRIIKKYIGENDIITIVGGGNFTNKYQEIEDIRNIWIKNFKNNRIVTFPQTIDFSSDEEGQKSFALSKKIIESHPDIHIFARETKSFSMMKEKLDAKVYLTPDIVLSLDESRGNKNINKSGILSCIRDDEESNFNPVEREHLLVNIKNHFGSDVLFTDTHLGFDGLSWDERDKALKEIWNKFKQSEVVVTDRLHGMIFSVITKTPCVVLLNNNHKISQTHSDWLISCGYIKLVNSKKTTDIIEAIETMRLINTDAHPHPILQDKYNSLVEVLNR
jgi:pyruvyl transferase EpsI